MEGALFGAAALRMLGHPPLLLDLEAVRDDDHVLAIFQVRGRWGAIAKSNYLRAPLPRAGVPHAARAGDVLLRALFQSAPGKNAAEYSRPVNLRQVRFAGLDDRRSGCLGDFGLSGLNSP